MIAMKKRLMKLFSIVLSFALSFTFFGTVSFAQYEGTDPNWDKYSSDYYYRQMIGQTTRRFDDRIIDSDTKFHHLLAALFRRYEVDKKTAEDIRFSSLKFAVFLILDRISYIDRFSNAKEKYAFLEKKPYRSVLNKSDSIIFKLCRARRYRTLYYYLKSKNRFNVTKKKVKEIISKRK